MCLCIDVCVYLQTKTFLDVCVYFTLSPLPPSCFFCLFFSLVRHLELVRRGDVKILFLLSYYYYVYYYYYYVNRRHNGACREKSDLPTQNSGKWEVTFWPPGKEVNPRLAWLINLLDQTGIKPSELPPSMLRITSRLINFLWNKMLLPQCGALLKINCCRGRFFCCCWLVFFLFCFLWMGVVWLHRIFCYQLWFLE